MGQLITFNNSNDLIAWVDYVAQSAVKAQFLKFNNIDQARQLALMAYTRGVDFFEACLAFDIIGGRLAKKSSAMLAELRARGGKHKILSRTSELASIEYTYDGQTQTFSLAWEQIKDEDYVKDKDGRLKPRYASPHGRMQMLWARLVSDSVGTIAPECKGGYYTPEETQDIIDGECMTVPASAGALPAPGGSVATSSSSQAAAAITTESSATQQVDVMISQEQQAQLTTLFAVLGITSEQVQASLATRKVSRLEELTAVQATEIIDKLNAMKAAKLPSTVGNASVQTSGPITQELATRIQEAIKVSAQIDGGAAINEAIFAHLQKHGLLIHQLTLAEGELLLTAINQRQVGLFLEHSLNGSVGASQGNA